MPNNKLIRITLPTELANLIKARAKDEDLSVPAFIHKVLLETEHLYTPSITTKIRGHRKGASPPIKTP